MIIVKIQLIEGETMNLVQINQSSHQRTANQIILQRLKKAWGRAFSQNVFSFSISVIVDQILITIHQSKARQVDIEATIQTRSAIITHTFQETSGSLFDKSKSLNR